LPTPMSTSRPQWDTAQALSLQEKPKLQGFESLSPQALKTNQDPRRLKTSSGHQATPRPQASSGASSSQAVPQDLKPSSPNLQVPKTRFKTSRPHVLKSPKESSRYPVSRVTLFIPPTLKFTSSSTQECLEPSSTRRLKVARRQDFIKTSNYLKTSQTVPQDAF
jgi:hypothetical protein